LSGFLKLEDELVGLSSDYRVEDRSHVIVIEITKIIDLRRWRAMADRKVHEVDAHIARAIK
jgi:hypothetical protein